MLKIMIAAGLALSPAALLAQSSGQVGAGMGTQADAAPQGGSTADSTSGQAMHPSGSRATHHARTRHTTRGASLSNDTMGAPNTSNSKSSTLNPMPH